jgi:nucleotide-binding universal stress UspA family protein
MKNILMAMDFSPSSINAYKHALSVAEKFNAGITLIWNETSSSIEELSHGKKGDIQELLKEKIAALNEENNLAHIPIKYIATKGTTYKEVIETSEKLKSDLIVVGHHGTHGVRRFFIGDNANKIIALAKCPVLTIQLHRAITRGLDKIVIAIDNTLDTRQKIPITMEFAKRFQAEVHVLGIYSSSVSTLKMRVDNYVRQAMASLKTKGIPGKHHFIKTTNISKTTLNYANQIGANLIVTMVDTEFFTKDVFLGKQGQQLVSQSHIPVLSIHNREIIKTRPGL